jgi:hypothetical protein
MPLSSYDARFNLNSWLQGAQLRSPGQVPSHRLVLVSAIKSARSSLYHYNDNYNDFRYFEQLLTGISFRDYSAQFDMVSSLMTETEMLLLLRVAATLFPNECSLTSI